MYTDRMNVLVNDIELLKYIGIKLKLYSIKSLIKKDFIVNLYIIMNT